MIVNIYQEHSSRGQYKCSAYNRKYLKKTEIFCHKYILSKDYKYFDKIFFVWSPLQLLLFV